MQSLAPPRAMIVSCLCSIVFWTSTNVANAADPSITANAPTIQSVINGQSTSWQYKATGNIADLPAGVTSVNVVVKFEKKPVGGNWTSTGNAISQFGAPVNNAYAIDTGFQSWSITPAEGEQFRVIILASYIKPPQGPTPIDEVISAATTPIP